MMFHSKQISAIRLAVGALERERRRNFAAGDHAYRHGMRSYEINGNGITGVGFGFAQDGHENYQIEMFEEMER